MYRKYNFFSCPDGLPYRILADIWIVHGKGHTIRTRVFLLVPLKCLQINVLQCTEIFFAVLLPRVVMDDPFRILWEIRENAENFVGFADPAFPIQIALHNFLT